MGAFSRLLADIDPGLSLVSVRELTGGVSARVTAVQARRPDGSEQVLTVRQYGNANLRSDPHSAAHEYQLLCLLRKADLAVPRPIRYDESGAALPGPLLVADFADGTAVTRPAQLTQPLTDFTGQLAAFLARLHQAAFTDADAPYLRTLLTAATFRVGTPPRVMDEALSEPAIRAALAGRWPPPDANPPVVLHGDYWPGNVLWRGSQLVRVLDWEDAAVGDPVADLANARMELSMAFGFAAATAFTGQYCALRPGIDLAGLPAWDLYAALRHAGRMAEWGLDDAERERLQSGHLEFASAALSAVAD